MIRCLFILSLFSFSAVAQRSPDTLFGQAEAAFDDGQYAKALSLLNNCLLEDPGFMNAYFMRAETRERLRDPEGALTDYSIVLENIPTHVEALLNRGRLRFHLKKYAQAAEDFHLFLKTPSGITQRIYFNQQARVSGVNQVMTAQSFSKPVVYNYLGLIALQSGRHDEALVWLDSAIHVQKGEADYFVNRALAYDGLGDTASARRNYKQALAVNPDHALALSNLGLLSNTDNSRAVALFTDAIHADSSALHPYLQRAKYLFDTHDYKGAHRDLSKALTLEDKNPEIWFTRGLVNERLRDEKSAYADYTKAITIKEDHFKSWINRANVLLKLERYQDAIEDYSVALVYHADFAAAYYNRAIARRYLSQHSAACEDLKLAIAYGMTVDENMEDQFCKEKN
ncbi:tetratricopeptide repeat protein [Pseudochryseolinea flava]|uniref:Tetratricopeptide repeat protein n=1 Tax=Pseudochryseolinea flava TaxID=2059302 RepID=A0A364XV27_9BACT|nr:tetratricopeptide repeat protein [Pseudochryseolinea flava]RAV98018.1 hypothetical protein DQQ10_25790 [Pseudochryseolinea flava]